MTLKQIGEKLKKERARRLKAEKKAGAKRSYTWSVRGAASQAKLSTSQVYGIETGTHNSYDAVQAYATIFGLTFTMISRSK